MIQDTGEGMRRSIDHDEAAIERAPTYALAYTGVAMAYAELAEIGVLAPEEAYPRGKDATARALELDGDLGEAHCMIALIKLVYDFDWSGAEQEFQRALKLSPKQRGRPRSLRTPLLGTGAVRPCRRPAATRLRARPTRPPVRCRHQPPPGGTMRGSTRSHALSSSIPANRGGTSRSAGSCSERGRRSRASPVALSPGDGLWLSQLGQAYPLAGRIDAARAILRQIEERSRGTYVSPYHLAYVYTGLGELDSAMDCLERAYAERAGAVYGIKGSFLFEPLRAHPRFQAGR
jgi:serine/threonine-protein kinase